MLSRKLVRMFVVPLGVVLCVGAAASVSASLLGAQPPTGPICRGDVATIVGSSSAETLNGTNGRDVIVAKGGADTINGRAGDDAICAGPGADVVRAGGGDDVVSGGSGADDLRGAAGSDHLLGGGGSDTANGGADDDICVAETEISCDELTPSPTATSTPSPTASASPSPSATQPPFGGPNSRPTDMSLSNGSVDEGEASGTPVGRFSTTDADTTDTHSYSLAAGTGDADNARFTIAGNELITAEVFDFETQGPFSIRVRTTDSSGDGYEEAFVITLININEQPQVNAATYSLPENSANGTAVGTPTFTDPDGAPPHTFSITAGNTNGAFAIDPTTGAITVADSSFLDFESTPSFPLTVRVQDTGSPAEAGTNTVTVNLTNVNEAPTNLSLSNSSVNENAASGTTVGNFSTTDPDVPDSHTLSLVSGTGDADNGRFTITSGVLQTDEVFDFETQGPFSIRVRTTDAGSLQYEEVLSISVTDVNDAPVVSAATVALDENSANGTSVHTVSATDEDSPAQTLTYSITSGNGLGAFAINSSTGAITVSDTSDLDFETTPSFALTVKATDNGSPQEDDSDTITIDLNDLNEAPDVNPASISLPENDANGTSVASATFTDQDSGQTHTFALTGGNTGGAFAINSSTGEITVADVTDVDFETNPSFSLTVEVTDNGTPNLTGSDTVTVDLTNVNEVPTDLALSNASVAENAAIGTAVGNLSATDPDAGDSHTFTLVSGTGDTDNSKFEIDNGALETKEIFDFETQGPFSIRVQAVDAGNLQYEEVLSISVTNVNEAPTIAGTAISLPENSANGTAVGTPSVTDPDAGQSHTWSITGGNTGGAFAIDPSTGAITVNDVNDVDFETNPTFGLSVRAEDSGSPALSDTETVTIDLTDVNDRPVVNAATILLAEDSANGTSVGTATATDQDMPAQPLTWAITAGNTGGAFAINSSTGEITVLDSGQLDFETVPSFSLTVEATDTGPLSDSDTITVNLTNVNEKPAITAPASVTARHTVPKGITGISIADPDAGANDIILTLGVADGVLTIDTTVINGVAADDVTGNVTDAVTITASPSQINTTLATASGLTYVSDPLFGGLSDTLALATNDQGATGSGGAQTHTGNVTISFNQPPTATSQTVATDEDIAATITLAGGDADGDTFTFKVTSLPATGKLHEGASTAGTEITAAALPYTLPADKVTYVPPANQNGPALETFEFKTRDGTTDSSAATVTINVTAVDDPPVAVNDVATMQEDASATSINVLANDTDVEGDQITISSATDPANGTVVLTGVIPLINTGLTYQPDADYCNNPPTIPEDIFTYTLNGGSVGTVRVTVTCVDDLPVAVNDSKTMDEDSTSVAATTINVLTNDTDVDSGPKTIESKTDGTDGTVTITNSGADLKYVPNANYCNTQPGGTPDTFTYTLNGGSSATVSVTVTCVDDAPVAVNDTKTVLEDATATTIDVLGNDTDIDGGPMFVDVKTNSTNGGTVTITNLGTDLTYAPAANYCNDPELQPAGGNLSETFNGTDSALSNFRLDNGTSTAGLDIAPATLHNVLVGDTDIEGDTISLIVGADCTGTGPFTCLTDGYDPDGPGGQPVVHGTVHLETDGDFHYTPPPGHVGSDSFDYRVSDGQATNSEANGTVNINIAGPTTWFVDDTAGAGGNGTSAAPFQAFTPLTTAGGSNHLDDANDNIFVYEGTYTSGIVLENGQKLLGHPHSLDITDTVGRTHTDLVSGAGTAPAISHAANTVVTLGSGNELQHLALGNGTISLAGTSVGTATVRDSSINTTGKALDINGGTLDMVFTNVTSTNSTTEAIKLNNAAGSFTAPAGTLGNANVTNAIVNISGASQDFTYGGAISDNGGPVISITNTIGGTKEFNGTISGADGGSNARINLTSNPGSVIRFMNDVTLNTLAQPALNATGGGTIHMPSDDNVLTTTSGIPLNVVSTTIGSGDLIFDSISSNGAPNGIVLDNTGNTGNLHVTGNPGADTNDGGTIANTSGADAATNQCAKPSGQPVGIGILLKDTNGVILNDMLINGSTNFGLLAHDVNGFTLDDSTFSGTHGNNDAQDEGTAHFCDLTGSATISDSVIGGAHEDGLKVRNVGGVLNRLTVSNTDFATGTGGFADDAFEASSTGGGTFNVTVNAGSAFTTAAGDHLQYSVAGTGTGDLVVQGNAFSNNYPSALGGGVTINPGGNSSSVNVTYNVSNNTFRDSKIPALTVTTGGTLGATGTYSGSISNNQIGVAGVVGSGAAQNSSGISFHHQGNGTHTVSIISNTVKQYTLAGIRLLANGGTPTVRATIQGNTVNEPVVSGNLFAGISIEMGSSVSAATSCIDLGGSAAQRNNVSTAAPSGTPDIILFPDGSSTMNLPGYVGPVNGAAAATAVSSYLAPRNNGDGAPEIVINDVAPIQYTGTGTNCL